MRHSEYNANKAMQRAARHLEQAAKATTAEEFREHIRAATDAQRRERELREHIARRGLPA